MQKHKKTQIHAGRCEWHELGDKIAANACYLPQSCLPRNLKMFNSSTCSASVQVAHEQIISSSIIVITWNKHEWTSDRIFFQPRKDVNTLFFKFKYTDFNLLSCSVCLLDKVANSVWLVRSPAIKLPVNGQLFTFSTSYRINVNCLDNLDKFDEKYFNSHWDLWILIVNCGIFWYKSEYILRHETLLISRLEKLSFYHWLRTKSTKQETSEKMSPFAFHLLSLPSRRNISDIMYALRHRSHKEISLVIWVLHLEVHELH